MKRFVFSLQALLDARQRDEDACRRRVGQFERERQAVESRIRIQQDLIGQSRLQMAGQLVGAIDVARLRGEGATSLRAIRAAQKLVLELAGVHKRLERARTDLLAATKKRRAVELLRDRRFAEWKAAMEKAETAAIDELAVQNARRNKDRVL
jgi:flagellar FliJ protein